MVTIARFGAESTTTETTIYTAPANSQVVIKGFATYGGGVANIPFLKLAGVKVVQEQASQSARFLFNGAVKNSETVTIFGATMRIQCVAFEGITNASAINAASTVTTTTIYTAPTNQPCVLVGRFSSTNASAFLNVAGVQVFDGFTTGTGIVRDFIVGILSAETIQLGGAVGLNVGFISFENISPLAKAVKRGTCDEAETTIYTVPTGKIAVIKGTGTSPSHACAESYIKFAGAKIETNSVLGYFSGRGALSAGQTIATASIISCAFAIFEETP